MRVSLLQEILDIYPALAPAERRVADLILGEPQDATAMTLDEIASRASVSQATASRFYRRLSAGAYPAFKVRLAQQLGAHHAQSDDQAGLDLIDVPAGSGNDAGAMLRDAAAQTRTALENAWRAVSLLSPESLQEAVATILDARSIVTCGFDLSGSVAWRLANLLRVAGLAARSERDPYHGAYWMDLLGTEDLIIVVSYRGNVPQILERLELARARGVTVLVVTNEARSALVDVADRVLLSRAPAVRSNDEYTSGDALFVQLAVTRTLWFALLAEQERRTAIAAPAQGDLLVPGS